MNSRIVAALFAAAALPVAAQVSPPRSDAQPPVAASTHAQKAAAKAPATARDRARLAKAQNKQGKRVQKPKQDPKKPPAT
jgi:hypothetical protein